MCGTRLGGLREFTERDGPGGAEARRASRQGEFAGCFQPSQETPQAIEFPAVQGLHSMTPCELENDADDPRGTDGEANWMCLE